MSYKTTKKVVVHKATGLFVGGFDDPALVRLPQANLCDIEDTPLKDLFEYMADGGEVELENLAGPDEGCNPTQPSTVIGPIEDFEEKIVTVTYEIA